jgi:hypothetical protein
MLNVAVTEMILNELHIRALVGERKATDMAEHVETGKQRKGGGLAIGKPFHILQHQHQRQPGGRGSRLATCRE